jgi:hypothetical protein
MKPIVERAKDICLQPATEWSVIAGESDTPKTLLTGYAAPLAAISAVAGFIGGSIVGRTLPFVGSYRVPIVSGVTTMIVTFVLAIVGVYVLSLIINALAPNFGGQSDSLQALKVAVYSYTPAWLGGVLLVLPGLGVLTLLASLYGLYLLYLGLPRLMKSPPDKALPYTAVVVVCAIVLSIVVAVVGGLFVTAPGLAGGALTSRAEPQVDPNSPLGRLQELGNRLDENNRKLEAAEKSGDIGAGTAAAMDTLGALLGGGRHVDPLALDTLKPFVPQTFAGLPQASSNAERSGIASLMVSKAEASYDDGGGRRATLEVTDSGGAAGLVGLAGWMGVEQQQEDASGVERTRRVDGRFVHEKDARGGGTNEFSVIVGERFIVSATGDGVSLDQLRAAVSDLDLAKLESLKDQAGPK